MAAARPSRRTARTWSGRAALGLLAIVVAYLSCWPVPIRPVAWDAPIAPALAGPFAPNERLSDAVVVAEVGEGPEDIARAPDGAWVTGIQDGRILRIDPATGDVQEIANTGGRPLGLAYDRDGRLLVADAKRGLLAVSDGVVTVLVDQVDGEPLEFADELAIAPDGRVWFSEASRRFGVAEFLMDALESRPSGRLLVWDPATGVARVALGGLHFANGVAVARDGASVFVVETFSYRVTRMWIQGPRAGASEPFVDNLPGFPDNIAIGDDGTMWIALAAPRNGLLDFAAPYPWMRKMIARLPTIVRPKPARHGFVLGVASNGTVRHNLQDPHGTWAMLTSAVPIDGGLALGSLHGHAVGRIALP